MSLYFTINQPHQWVTLGAKGVENSGVADSLSELPVAGQRCIAVVPGEQVVTRVEVMPVKNRAKLMAAIPFAIEDSLISRVDDLHFLLLDIGDAKRVTFAYVSRQLMTSWLAQIHEAGIKVDAMLPDYFLLPGAAPDTAVITMTGDKRVLVRSGLYQGAVIDPGNLPAWLNELDKETSLITDDSLAAQLPDEMGRRLIKKKIGGGLLDWLSQGVPDYGAGLLNREFTQGSKRSFFKQYWPAVAMIALAGFIKLGSDVAELVWLQKTNTQLEQSMQSLYQELFPGSKLLPGRARVQTKNKIYSLQNRSAGNDFTYLLVTSSALLKSQQVTYEELDYRDGQLVAVLTLNDFAHLDRVRQKLQDDPSLNVSLKQSGARGSKVQARFVITRQAT
ncbi:MAG: type II secretion system protein GspL [Pseudomonadota bacterium]|nr:type II secretion system protein GspL [Pseudomonadota bacterium]